MDPIAIVSRLFDFPLFSSDWITFRDEFHRVYTLIKCTTYDKIVKDSHDCSHTRESEFPFETLYSLSSNSSQKRRLSGFEESLLNAFAMGSHRSHLHGFVSKSVSLDDTNTRKAAFYFISAHKMVRC